MRSWQNLVTSSYSIRTSPIYKQSSVCHADTIQLLHVAYTEQSAHQTSSPNIDIDICVHSCRRSLNSAFPFFFAKITMAMLMGANFRGWSKI